MDEVEVTQKKVSSQFQNRLVGIIVIVALGVIFLPDILDGKKQHQEEQFAEIPLRPTHGNDFIDTPNIESIDLSDTKAPFTEPEEKVVASNAVVEESKSQAVESQSTKSQAKTESKAKPEPTKTEPKNAEKAPVKSDVVSSTAYTLQLGSFKNAANVNALVKQLRDNGFKAYTIPQKPVDGNLTKVFVGPDISKEKLEKRQKKVEQLTGLKSAVVSYNPTE